MSSLIVDKKKLKKYVDASTTPTVLALFAIGLAGCGGSSNVIPNTNPVAQSDAVITNEDGSVVIDVLANDSDVDGDDLTITDVAATNGSVIINTDNTVTYTPNTNYYGSDTITYSISDSNGGTAVSTVSVSIVEVNDSPVVSILITDDSTDEGVGYSYDASVNFSDVDVNDVLTYSATLSDSSALPSWISIDENSGILSGTPGSADVGIINITVTASDGTLSASDTFQLEILEDLSGVASDGPLKQALVFLDLDNDDTLDAGEAFDITNAQGEYTLTGISAADKAQGTLVAKSIVIEDGFVDDNGSAVATLDTISGSSVENLVMRADASEASVITPLTTLVESGISSDDVLEILGLDNTKYDINTYNPFSDVNRNTVDATNFEKVATQTFTALNAISEALGSSVDGELSKQEIFSMAVDELAKEVKLEADKTVRDVLKFTDDTFITKIADNTIASVNEKVKVIKQDKVNREEYNSDLEYETALNNINGISDENSAKFDKGDRFLNDLTLAIKNANKEIDKIETFDDLSAQEILKTGVDDLGNQVKDAVNGDSTTISLANDGSDADDTLSATRNNDEINGYAGTDTVVFTGSYSDYTVTQSDDKSTLQVVDSRTGAYINQGSNTLRSIEKLQFDDVLVDVSNTGTGGEFLANYGRESVIQILQDGSFLIVWNNSSQIVAQLFDSSGTQFDSFFVGNSYSNSTNPDVSVLGEDSFFIAWEEEARINAQRYNLIGEKVGAQVQLNSGGGQPSIALINNSEVIVSWSSSSIFAQRFDINLVKIGEEFLINTTTQDLQSRPNSSMATNGSSITVWDGINQDGDGWGVFAQRFDSSYSPIGSEFQVNSSTYKNQQLNDVTFLDGGNFVIVWHDSNGSNIKGKLYDSDGLALGNEFTVNTYATHTQTHPNISSLEDGGFIIVWQSEHASLTNVGDIYAQRYHSDGSKYGLEFIVSVDNNIDPQDANVARLDDGGFIVSWHAKSSSTYNYYVYAQRFDAEGNSLGTVTLNAHPVSTLTIQDQSTDEENAYSFDASSHFNDVDISDTLTYSATLSDGSILPTWLSINPSTGVLSGTSTSTDSNALNIKITATDNAGASVSNAFLLTVNDTILAGTTADDNLIVTTDTISVRAGTGNDAAIFSGNYADYTISQSDSFVTLITDNRAEEPTYQQTVALHSVEKLQFNDALVGVHNTETGGEFIITSNSSRLPEIEGLNGGGFVATWYFNGDSYAQIYGEGGNKVGDEFITIDGDIDIHGDKNSKISALPDGGFIIAGSNSYSNSENGFNSIIKKFDADGVLTKDVSFAAYYDSFSYNKDIVALDNGNSVFSWADNGLIYAQTFDSNGNLSGDTFRVDTGSSWSNQYPNIDNLYDGGFVIIWTTTDGKGNYWLVAQRYDENSNSVGSKFDVFLSDSSIGIGGQLYDSSGNIIVENFQTDSQKVASLINGDFIVIGDGHAQRYDAEGNPLGTVVLHTNTPTLVSEIQDQSVDEEGSYSFDASTHFTDADVGDILTYTATLSDGSTLPGWLSINAESGVLSGTPVDEDSGSIEITVTASDIIGNIASNAYLLEVNDTILTGTIANDNLLVHSNTATVRAGKGEDTIVLSGNYSNYTFSQSDSFVPLITHNTSGQVVSLYDAEFLQFYDVVQKLSTGGDGEFQVNTYTTSVQENSSVAALNNGGFVVTYESYEYDNATDAVVARVYDGNGNASPEFLVNTFTTWSQFDPDITTLNNGNFIITWTSGHSQDGSSNGVYAQIFSEDGVRIGGEFLVNTTTQNSQGSSSVSSYENGFVVAWSGWSDSDDTGVYIQIYDSNSVKVGEESRVNTDTSNYSDQQTPSIAGLADGGFVVIWDGSGNTGVTGQMFDVDGNKVGSEFEHEYPHDYFVEESDVIALNSGGFVVTWVAYGGQGYSYDVVHMAVHDASGSVITGEDYHVSNYGNDYGKNPVVSPLENGFIIMWDNFGEAIKAQKFDDNGLIIGDEIIIETNIAYTDIVALSDGGFVVTGEISDEIYTQRFDADGNPLGNISIDSSTFIIRESDGNTDINLADIITDFTDGEDLLGGAGDIEDFSQLTVAQGTGDYTTDTVISLTTTGEILAVLDDFTATNFDANDFVALDIV